MDPLSRIHVYLTDFRRRLCLLHLVRDTALFICGVSVLLLCLLLLASASAYLTTVRIISLLLLTVMVSGFATYMTLVFRRLQQPSSLARMVGQHMPALRSDLVSTVELAQEASQGIPRFSRTLLAALAEQTLRGLARRPASSLVPARHLRPAAVLTAAVALGWGTTVLLVPQRVIHGATRILSSAGAGQRPQAAEPLVGDLAVTYQYPRYMGRPRSVVESTTGHLVAPKGTRIQLRTTALVPCVRGALVLSPEGAGIVSQRLRLLVGQDGTELSGTFVLSDAGTYRFELEGPDGRPVLDPVKRRIELEPDAFPRVTMYGPVDGLEVTGRERLEIGYTAEDDHGLARIRLAYQVGTAAPVRVPLWGAGREAHQRSLATKTEWSLDSVEGVPGARIAYWIEALDTDTISGPKVGRSATRTLKVYSVEEKHGTTLKLLERALEQGIRILGDRLLLFEKEPPLSPALRLDASGRTHQLSSRFVDSVRELRNQMRQDPLSPQSLRRIISQVHQRVRQMVRQEAGLLREVEAARRRAGNVSRPRLVPLREHNTRLVVEMERDVLLLSNLLDELRLQNLSELSLQMQKTRKKLAKLLQRYHRAPSEALRKEIARLMRELEQQVERFLAEAGRMRSRIPAEYLNPEAMDKLDLRGELQRMKRLLQEGKLDQLGASVTAMEQRLRQLDSLLQGNLQNYRKGRMGEQERALSELMDRLRGLESEQRDIASRTARIIQGYHRRAAEMMKRQIQPLLRRELAKVAELRRRVGEIDPRSLGSYDQEQLHRIKQRIQDLKGMLEQADLHEALRMARRTRNSLRVLEDDLYEEMEERSLLAKGQVRQAYRRSRAAHRLASELVSELEGIFPHPGAMLDRQERQQLAELARRQQALRRTAQQLAGRAGREPELRPYLGESGPAVLKDSAELMGKALGKLRGTQLQEAHGLQETAAERLAQLQKQMQQARQPLQIDGSSGMALREQVKIPGADAFRPPRAFRQDILEAMKERAPEAFQEQVKRYYEELVR